MNSGVKTPERKGGGERKWAEDKARGGRKLLRNEKNNCRPKRKKIQRKNKTNPVEKGCFSSRTLNNAIFLRSSLDSCCSCSWEHVWQRSTAWHILTSASRFYAAAMRQQWLTLHSHSEYLTDYNSIIIVIIVFATVVLASASSGRHDDHTLLRCHTLILGCLRQMLGKVR